MPSGRLGEALAQALTIALRGLRDFPGAGQPTDDLDVRRFPLEGLPYTLFYRYNRAHRHIDILALRREPHPHDLKITEWMESRIQSQPK